MHTLGTYLLTRRITPARSARCPRAHCRYRGKAKNAERRKVKKKETKEKGKQTCRPPHEKPTADRDRELGTHQQLRASPSSQSDDCHRKLGEPVNPSSDSGVLFIGQCTECPGVTFTQCPTWVCVCLQPMSFRRCRRLTLPTLSPQCRSCGRPG